MPFQVGAHLGMVSGFTILKFPQPEVLGPESAMSTVVYTESYTGGSFIDQPAAVRQFVAAFAKIRASALPGSTSVDRVRSIARTL